MSDTYARYIGNGSFIQGLPTVDLNKSQWDELGSESQKKLLDAGLYELVSKNKKVIEKGDD